MTPPSDAAEPRTGAAIIEHSQQKVFSSAPYTASGTWDEPSLQVARGVEDVPARAVDAVAVFADDEAASAPRAGAEVVGHAQHVRARRFEE